jgi:multiple sugar transport system substrate-binding protein
VLIAGSGYGIASTATDPAAAWKLVRFLGGPEGQKLLATTGLAQPAIKKLAASKVFLDGQKPLNKKMLLKAAEKGYTSPALGSWSEFYDGIWRPQTDLIWTPDFAGGEEAMIKAAVAQGNTLLFKKKP